MAQNIDTNIDNYTISELLTILDLDNEPTPDEITEKSNFYIDKFTNENNEEMINFFTSMQNTLLQYFEDINDNEENGSPTGKQTSDWFENQVLKQDVQELRTQFDKYQKPILHIDINGTLAVGKSNLDLWIERNKCRSVLILGADDLVGNVNLERFLDSLN